MAGEQNHQTHQKLRGAEGLLDLGFFADAAPVLEELAQTDPQNSRVWLAIARVRSRNFTLHSPEIQPLLDKAADCARTVDDYNYLQETAGWYAAIKPYAYARKVDRVLPDTEQLARIKPIRVPLSSEEGVKQAREISRMTFLKFLLIFVLVLGLPVGFIVSCTQGKNPIINAINKADATPDPQSEITLCAELPAHLRAQTPDNPTAP